MLIIVLSSFNFFNEQQNNYQLKQLRYYNRTNNYKNYSANSMEIQLIINTYKTILKGGNGKLFVFYTSRSIFLGSFYVRHDSRLTTFRSQNMHLTTAAQLPPFITKPREWSETGLGAIQPHSPPRFFCHS